MTTENKTKVAFYIYVKGENGENKNVGAAFAHKKGNGLNIVIGNARYTAFPPKTKTANTEEEGV